MCIIYKTISLSLLRLFWHGFPFNCGSQETETGHGIMEEPELTLVSTTDTSIAEMDFANLTLEEKSENEAKSFFQVNLSFPSILFYYEQTSWFVSYNLSEGTHWRELCYAFN